MQALEKHRYQITFYIIADNTSFGINGRVFRFHNDKIFSTCKENVLLVLTRARHLPIKWRVCYALFTRGHTGRHGWQVTRSLKTHFWCSWKLNWIEVKHFLKKVFFLPLDVFSGNIVFQKCFATPIYIPKYTLSKKLIFSIPVLPLCLKTLKKIPVKELNFSANISGLWPATILKNELCHFLFFKLFDHGCRTLLENTFSWLFLETFLETSFYLKILLENTFSWLFLETFLETSFYLKILLENTFSWLFLETFLETSFYLKIQVKY